MYRRRPFYGRDLHSRYRENPVEKIKLTDNQLPYADKVTIYVNQGTGEAVPVWVVDRRTGWLDVYVGEYMAKARPNDTHVVRKELLSKYYPEFTDEISTFDDLSFHSYLAQGRAEKIGNYGTHDYNLDFFAYELVDEYKLVVPINSTRPKKFGEKLKKVRALIWHYIVLDWIPSEPTIRLQIKYKKEYPDGTEENIYTSRRYSIREKSKAISEFKQIVREFKEQNIKTVKK